MALRSRPSRAIPTYSCCRGRDYYTVAIGQTFHAKSRDGNCITVFLACSLGRAGGSAGRPIARNVQNPL